MFYEVGAGAEHISYGNPPPLVFSNAIGSFTVADGVLRIDVTEHFSDEDGARQLVEPFLKSWEIQTDLAQNLGQLRFKFRNSRVIDRNPPAPGEPHVISARGFANVSVAGQAMSANLRCNKYPEPPSSFAANTDVQLAHARWVQFREGREPLQSMAYFVLTQFKGRPGGLEKAGLDFNLSSNFLTKVGVLSSRRGDAKTARKMPGSGQFVDLTPRERDWLDAAVKILIRRLGEHASGTTLDRITLASLPSLP